MSEQITDFKTTIHMQPVIHNGFFVIMKARSRRPAHAT